jgi:hypothetical protein
VQISWNGRQWCDCRSPPSSFLLWQAFRHFPHDGRGTAARGDSEADSQGNWGGGFLDQIRRKRFFFAKKTLARRESL